MRLAVRLLLCAWLPTSAYLYPNKLLELRIANGAVLPALDRIEALIAAARDTASGILLIVEDGDSDGPTDASLVSLPSTERANLLRREHAARESLRQAAGAMPIIAVVTSQACDGAAAGLTFAAAHRVVTERTRVAMRGVQLGVLPSGLTLLGAITRDDKRGVAMALALGAVALNSHDMHHLQLSRFVPSADVPDLLADLRCAPTDFFDVPLLRRCREPPPTSANLFLTPVIDEAIESIFGESQRSVAEVRAKLESESARAAKLLNSNSWRTRECAEAVEDMLGDARRALGHRQCSPSVLAATFTVLTACFRGGLHGSNRVPSDGGRPENGHDGRSTASGGGDRGGSTTSLDAHAVDLAIERAHHLEYLVTAELAAQSDSEHGASWAPEPSNPEMTVDAMLLRMMAGGASLDHDLSEHL